MGMNAMLMNAKVLLAQPTPKFLYMAPANKGKPAPKQLRNKSLPAMTLGMCLGYASGR